jgi:hypothetical protein
MFTPTNPDKVFDNLTDPSLTLRDVAELNDTTLESLTLWMFHPDIAARLDNFESAIARRTRLLALNYLPAAVETLHSTLIAHNDQELNTPFKPNCIKSREFQRRSRETARKAAALLLRLTRFDTNRAPEPKQANLDLHKLRASRTNSTRATDFAPAHMHTAAVHIGEVGVCQPWRGALGTDFATDRGEVSERPEGEVGGTLASAFPLPTSDFAPDGGALMNLGPSP